MGFYLLDHPPKARQFLTRRRRPETGGVVVHTPEGGVDLSPPDTKAEDVARFIASRPDHGSYHWISDSDSSVHMIPWTYEAAQDATGSNPWAVGLSIACNAADWPRLLRDHPAWVEGALAQAARGARAYAADLHARTGIVIPARRITRAESDRGLPGFLGHGDRDPARRSDPGPGFPWERFLALYADQSEEDDDMADPRQIVRGPKGDVYLFDGATLRPANDETYRTVLKLSGAGVPTPEQVAAAVAVFGPDAAGVAGEWFQWNQTSIDKVPPAPGALDVPTLAAAIAKRLPPGTALDPEAIATEVVNEIAGRLAT